MPILSGEEKNARTAGVHTRRTHFNQTSAGGLERTVIRAQPGVYMSSVTCYFKLPVKKLQTLQRSNKQSPHGCL